MEQMVWGNPDIAYCLEWYFQWYIALPNILNIVVLPLVTFFFFCGYCRVSFSWLYGGIYLVLSLGLSGGKYVLHIEGCVGLMLETVLLFLWGGVFLKGKWMKALSMAVLILSILSVTNSMVRWLDYRIVDRFVITHESLVIPSDAVRECFKVLLVMGFFALILKKFRESIADENELTLLQLTVPAFFIALLERVIQDSIYGNGLIVDWYTKEILPNVNINYGEILFVQVLACACLLVTLFVHQKMVRILDSQRKLELLKQQAAEQENYIKEAKVRYQQTSSFRHDIKNHLTVLAELLKAGEGGKAREYLENLGDISDGLSYPVWTGNAAVDALLGSKCFIADQKGIGIRCEIKLPEDAGVKDVDWCIILANGIDNAIAACENLDQGERYIHISNKRKGNFYVLSIENSCRKNMGKLPEEGTGLFNIRNAAGNYKGKVETMVSQGVFKLHVLFIIPPSHTFTS